MEQKAEYYLPGSNANLFTIRKEVGRDPNDNPGHGEITEIEITAKKAFHVLSVHDELLEALKACENMLCNVHADECEAAEMARAAIAKAEDF